ncbi:degV family protein [Thermincola ferriacetica]|uniref:DegV family protein n=1 Tax=Thermincola ferriacetica TaxID=281456 RepID=A0A0L6W1V1_9FIRM|nr:DegV family protein [Thermincola ferriacetica]KNZ69378.1 degV family protein [Thermincola ferriacetica]
MKQKEKIAIVTDSTCDLEREFIEKNDVHVLPLRIIYQGKEYRDKIDIEPQEIYERMPGEIPKTSMPGFGEITEVFTKLKEQGFNRILSMHISGGLSGTVNAVQMAARQISEMHIEVLDSKALSLGLGFLVNKAVRLRDAGCVFDEIVEKVKKTRDEIKVFFVVKTLEYLRKGGRIGLIEGTLGDLLNIKPIVSINEEGKYFTYAKVRGRKKSMEELVEIAKEYIREKAVNLAVMHSGAEADAREVREKLLNTNCADIREFFWGQIGPSMVVHSGPGLVGIGIQPVD